MAENLLDRDTLNRKEFEMVMNGEELPPKTEAEQVSPSADAQAEPTPAPETDGADMPAVNVGEAEDDDTPFIEPGENK